jgi:hypothetical protein
MSLKNQILNKIKSISDPNLLRELDVWIRQAEVRKYKQVNEPGGTYHTEGTVKKRDKTASQKKGKPDNKSNSAIDYLEKIANKGGVKGIVNPVEWQRKERQDRTLTIS